MATTQEILEQATAVEELPKRKGRKPEVDKTEKPTPLEFSQWKKAAPPVSQPVGTRKRKPVKEKEPPPDMPKAGVLKESLTGLYAGIGMMLMPFDAHCGSAVIEAADACAGSLEDLAKTNPAVRKALMTLVKTSAWGTVIAAHAPLIMAIMAHHGPTKVIDHDDEQTGLFRRSTIDNPQWNGDRPSTA